MKKYLIILFLMVSASVVAEAQCPMCKTAIESGMKDGHTLGRGLNSGIKYLLAAPYLGIAVVGGAWYYSKKKK